MPTPLFCYISPMVKDKRGLGDVEFAGKVKTQTFKQYQQEQAKSNKQNQKQQQQKKKEPEKSAQQLAQVPRGKRNKLKKIKEKYADQDEDERKMRLMLLGAKQVEGFDISKVGDNLKFTGVKDKDEESDSEES